MQLKYTLFSSISMLAFSSLSVFSQTEKMNVLFLMADDMRPELGCYGVKEVKTPNIDRFAASGLLFQNAYCNIPVSLFMCGFTNAKQCNLRSLMREGIQSAGGNRRNSVNVRQRSTQ